MKSKSGFSLAIASQPFTKCNDIEFVNLLVISKTSHSPLHMNIKKVTCYLELTIRY